MFLREGSFKRDCTVARSLLDCQSLKDLSSHYHRRQNNNNKKKELWRRQKVSILYHANTKITFPKKKKVKLFYFFRKLRILYSQKSLENVILKEKKYNFYFQELSRAIT